LKITLAAPDPALARAWRAAFADTDVIVTDASILEVECDALVSPANSFGFMDGGIDAIYSEHFGWDLQLKLRRKILGQHHGELLVGAAALVETGNERHPYLIAAPTMRVPMTLEPETIAPYLATRAALLLIRFGQIDNRPVSDHVKSAAFPGMGTGVGRVPAEICARQMRTAYNEVVLGDFELPTSWAEASERHQLLYTDKPTRLQF
jgi:O-acetyl-ADP-ribose deacetylase (regulator of RNase III)